MPCFGDRIGYHPQVKRIRPTWFGLIGKAAINEVK